MAAPKNIADITTEITHGGTTHQKRLVTVNEHHTGDVATINYAWLEVGKQLSLHAHPDGEEFYFFLEGTGEILVGNSWFAVSKGSFVIVPQANNHSVKNTGSATLTFLTVRTVNPNH